MLLLGAAESTPKGIPRQGHVAIERPRGRRNDAQLFAQKRSMLQVKQANDLNFFTVKPTSPPATAMIPVFHGISRAEDPFKQGHRRRWAVPRKARNLRSGRRKCDNLRQPGDPSS